MNRMVIRLVVNKKMSLPVGGKLGCETKITVAIAGLCDFITGGMENAKIYVRGLRHFV